MSIWGRMQKKCEEAAWEDPLPPTVFKSGAKPICDSDYDAEWELFALGKRRVKVEPWPGWLVASMVAPWASRMLLQMARPSPQWPSAGERAVLTR